MHVRLIHVQHGHHQYIFDCLTSIPSQLQNQKEMPRLNEAQRNNAVGRLQAGEARFAVARAFNPQARSQDCGTDTNNMVQHVIVPDPANHV